MEFFLKKPKKMQKSKKIFFFFYNRTSFIRVFPNLSQFSNFVWDNGDKNGDSDGDVTDENFALKLKEGIVNMYSIHYIQRDEV